MFFMKKLLIILILSFFLGMLYWGVDSAIDCYVFKENTFLNVFYKNVSIYEFCNRIFFVICFFVFGTIFYFLVEKIKDKERKAIEKMENKNKLITEIISKDAIKLKYSNEELEQFAYVSSHDLQEPLRVVSSYCQLLKERCKDCKNMNNETKKWINYIVEATERMKILIKELLDFSSIGRKDKPFEDIDLNKIIKNVEKDLKFLIKDTNTKIIIKEPLPIINGIKFRIKQLFYNLINNSIKFKSDKDPLIEISFCEEKDSKWLFCVKDNGIGISSKYFDRIFGLFKRLYSREEYPGTGIGLALCKKIVETHGGKIWVDSKVNKGASFYFILEK